MKAQGEVGAAIANDPNMQARLTSDPQGAQVEINAMIANRVAALTIELAQSEAMGQKQDPLVMLKQRELDLRAMDMQRKSEESMMNMDIKENQIEEQLDIEKMKLENNEAQVARENKSCRRKIRNTKTKEQR